MGYYPFIPKLVGAHEKCQFHGMVCGFGLEMGPPMAPVPIKVVFDNDIIGVMYFGSSKSF